MMKPSEAFVKAAEIIAEPGMWRQGTFGYYPCEDKIDLGSYCMIGAARKASGIQIEDQFRFYEKDIAAFNDADDATQDDAILGCLVLAEYFKDGGR